MILPRVVSYPGFRLVKYRELCSARKDGGYFDTLQLATGETGVQLAVDVVACAKTDLGKVAAGLVYIVFLARCKIENVAHAQTLELYRLLECIAYARARPLGDGKGSDVRAVKQYLTG